MSRIQLKPVILCGGAGTRLWPLSNGETPKQFLNLVGDVSMLTQTADRVARAHSNGLVFSSPLAIGALRHESLLREHLPGAQLLLEPFGRNSAAAVAAAALVSDPEDLLLILPADHFIAYPERFHAAIEAGIDRALKGHVVTFGIEPTFPSTGYGYIELEDASGSVRRAKAFVEKPDAATAARYVSSGRYVWNAGIFLFKASAMLDAFQSHAPDILSAVRASLPSVDRPFEAGDAIVIDPDTFENCPSISVDYAIMEKLSSIYGVPVEMGWSDVGDYGALWDLSDREEDGNVLVGKGGLLGTRGCYVRSEHLPVYVSGVQDLIIVANDRHIMICPRERSQDVKKLANLASEREAKHSDLHQKARQILIDQFELWLDRAWDDRNGGFFESLDGKGQPIGEAPRRTRVAARQVFSFASGTELGVCDAEKARTLIGRGLDLLLGSLRNPSGGWAHTSNADGSIADATEDLYDHAFIILAGATAYRVTGDERGLEMANAAMAYIKQNWLDPDCGGFFEGSSPNGERRANPHMHLLEAFLAMHAATRDQAYLDCARDMVVLFESRFFDPRTDILREFFHEDWRPLPGERGVLFEPGHHFEWATLLLEFERRSGRDTVSWRRRLIAKADREGSSTPVGFCFNAVLADGKPVDTRMRLWPQLEKLRAKFMHDAPQEEVSALLTAIEEVYLQPAGSGLLIDEVDADQKPLDKPVPASMLYHMVTALGVLIVK